MINCYRAEPMSRRNIQQFVRKIKAITGFEDELYFPVVDFMELVLPSLIPDFSYEIATISEMGNLHGETYPSKNVIRIREDVYERAIKDEGRDRLTIAHEIGHLMMHEDDSIALCRVAPDYCLKPYENPEWQADCFGGELLASSYLISGMNTCDVVDICKVSFSAAEIQLRNSYQINLSR